MLRLARLTRIVLLAAVLVSCRRVLPSTNRPGVNPTRPPSVVSQREYLARQTFRVNNAGPGSPQKQNLWVALISDWAPYQEVSQQKISPAGFKLVVDENGNRYAEFDLAGQAAGEMVTVQIETRVIVNELAYDLEDCLGELPFEFTQPELHIESANPQIVSLAQELAAGSETPCQQVRAFYDYVGRELVYTVNGRNWGAQAALGPMGADCTEYSDLLAALSRSQGIPARYFEGLLYNEAGVEITGRPEHAWVDVYLPGAGWVSIDPTLGRSSVDHEGYFAHHTPEHIIVTLGASPSTLRGSSYWTHLYWPGDITRIEVKAEGWEIELVE